GTVTFTDANNKTVVVSVNGGQTNYTANLTTLADGAITSTLALNTDSAGNSFTPVADTSIKLDKEPITGTPTFPHASARTVAEGGSVPLGIVISAVDSDDVISVAISGVPTFESVSAAGVTPTVTRQGSTFTYTFNALPAADWNNGLVLSSTFPGKGHPTNPLTVAVSNITAGESFTSPVTTITRTPTPPPPPP